MDLTIRNFKEKLPVIEEAIKSAEFISIDGEFSGLNQTWNLSAYDTPEERFQKVRQNAEDFLLIQFGLCTFHYDSDTEKYTHQAFNMYVFPRPCRKITPDKRFYCQASSLNFLSSQGFDFNKLIKEGIPYVRASDELSLREALIQRQVLRQDEEEALAGGASSSSTSIVPDDHKNFIENIHTQVNEFLASERSSLLLTPCSAYRRRLIYETVKPKFLKLSLETVQTDEGQSAIQILKADQEEIKKRAELRIKAETEQLEDAIGVTKVVQMISKSRKLVVGHNMFLDLLHVVHQFCCELPQNYEEIKEVMKTVLPRVLDTKLMTSVEPFKEHFHHTGLSNIFKRVNEAPFSCPIVEPAEKCPGYDKAKEQLHEAGYDAYITGLCYISLAKHLCALQMKKTDKSIKNIGNLHLIEPFLNKVFMMMSPDIPYLNLAGFDLHPNRDHVFHVTFPSEWKSQDIMNLFTPYGPVSISWIDNVSAFVALKHAEKSLIAMKCLMKKETKEYHVITFSEYFKRKHQSHAEDKCVISGLNHELAHSFKRKRCDKTPTRLVMPELPQETKVTEEITSYEGSPILKKSKLTNKLFEEPSNWE